MRVPKRLPPTVGIVCSMLILTVMIFQNCSGFQPVNPFGSGDTASAGTGGTTTVPNIYAGVHNTDYATCYAATPTDPNALASCLNGAAVLGASFSSDTINTCFSAGNTSLALLAVCLGQQGEIVLENRPPKQYDIDQCLAKVPESNLSSCLYKNGVGVGVAQTDLDNCVNSAGVTMVETCLRSNGLVPKRGALMQSDAALCTTLTGGTTALASCLQNAGVLSSTVMQSSIDTCVTNVGAGSVVKCLRNNYLIPKVLMQFHIADCNAAAGLANIAACLDKSGVLPVDDTVAANVTAFQSDVTACNSAAGPTMIGQCLRTKGYMTTHVMQPHIDYCFNSVGMNALACLTTNFPSLPASLTTAALQACFAKNNNSSLNAASCLASQGILPSAPAQDQIAECDFLAGDTADTTGMKPGQVGIAACLNKSALVPSTLTAASLQTSIDACIAKVGLAGVSTCLHNNAVVASYSALTSTTGVLGKNCIGCHNTTEKSGGLDWSSYAAVIAAPNNIGTVGFTKVITPGDATTSLGYDLPNTGVMPPTPRAKLAQTDIDLIALWINQGANNN